MKKLFLLTSIKEVPLMLTEGLKERGLGEQVEISTNMNDAEIIVADPGMLIDRIGDVTERVKWVQSTWAGVNRFFGEGGCVLPKGILLTRAEGMFGDAMAEYVMGHILHRERRFNDAAEFQQAKIWKETDYFRQCRPLRSLTLGILGYGNIGKKVAAAAQVFGMQTIGLTRSSSGKGTTHDIREVLAQSDYIVNILPETKETIGVLTADSLAAHCTRAPTFINVGRGSAITEADIIAAVDAGTLSAAILDVVPTEPLPPTSPLWTHPKVTITPHISAITLAADIAALTLDNIERYLSRDPLVGTVSIAFGY
eukprot:TRINITY_DN22649_c0_g1_i1.p1 TRINITY_DN22649_c0_g1~~TRINITY_DN22649_c0_g1_i1.p1  ORF type:complete len:311 (+),score=74.30 TRINITY_DN22649_c0_g1_i1:45-977(+)